MSAIISRNTWGARHRNGVGNRAVGKLEKYLHHTVTTHLSENATPEQERAQMRIIEQIGQQRFGAGISYSFLIFPSGRIYEGASVDRISYHSGAGRNTRGVGICLAGNYEANRLGSKTRDAIVWLLQEGVRRKWWGDPALTSMHRNFRATSCPGKWAANEFADINRSGRGQVLAPAKNTGTASKPSTGTASTGANSKAWPHSQLSVTSKHTTASHNAWVKMLAGVGFKDKSLTTAVQRWLQWNGYYKGYRVDGKWGGKTTQELQKFLKAKGFYKGTIDEHRGPVTIQAEIRYINSQARHYK